MGYNLYTDLDTLYDTRFELIKLINPYEASKILKDGSYINRFTERYGNIPYDIFYPLWRKRNKNLFIKANLTPMLIIIRQYFAALYVTNVYSSVKDQLVLYVNTYPYRLTEKEIKDTEKYIANHIRHIEVKCIYKSNKDLTTHWVADNIGTMFKYDYLDWLNYHVTLGEYNLSISRVTAIIPGVINTIGPNNAVKPEDIELLPERYKLYATLDIIDTKNFSCQVINVSN